MGSYVPVRAPEGGGWASWGIGPGSSGGICPGSRQEPGPMGLATSPQPLIPVCGSTRDERLAISTGSSHKPGLTIWLYIHLAGEQSTPLVLCFFEEDKGRAFWCSSSPPMHMMC